MTNDASRPKSLSSSRTNPMNLLSPLPAAEPPFGPAPRRATVAVRVGEGEAAVLVGGGAPIVVQSMTNTDTADVAATARQVAALSRAGSERFHTSATSFGRGG